MNHESFVALLLYGSTKHFRFKCFMHDTLIQTSHTFASTCDWPCGGNVYRVLNRKANIHVRFTWTSFDDRANQTITANHIHRWQLANSFCSSAYHSPLTVYPVLTKQNKNKYFSRYAFSSEYRNKTSWNRQQLALAGKRRIVLSRPDVVCYSVRVDQKRTGIFFQNRKSNIGSCFEILDFVVT